MPSLEEDPKGFGHCLSLPPPLLSAVYTLPTLLPFLAHLPSQ